MSQQPMNLRRAFELIRRNKAVVGGAVGLGLIIGAAFGSINPPQLTSSALVILPNTKIATKTLLVISRPAIRFFRGPRRTSARAGRHRDAA